eukprot:COSAG02_NODE_10288_length_1977_cov_1.615016_2_plen_297_part_00
MEGGSGRRGHPQKLDTSGKLKERHVGFCAELASEPILSSTVLERHGVQSDVVPLPSSRVPSETSAFGSMRFDGIVPEAAKLLQRALAERGVSLEIIDMMGGGDIDREVFSGIEQCSTFIVFGSERYGEDTGNSACTHYEYKHAVHCKKKIILIRMIPFDQEFDELHGRVIFGQNKLVFSWMLGSPMPTGLVDDVIKAMGIKAPPGGDQEPEPEPESQPELELELEPEPPELDAWLVQVDLAQYGPQIKEYGYDKLKALLVATEEDIVAGLPLVSPGLPAQSEFADEEISAQTICAA